MPSISTRNRKFKCSSKDHCVVLRPFLNPPFCNAPVTLPVQLEDRRAFRLSADGAVSGKGRHVVPLGTPFPSQWGWLCRALRTYFSASLFVWRFSLSSHFFDPWWLVWP